ncbi:MAG: hypothetical protein IPK78_05030 [Rhodospirillales bacterium]|nr:hypothetical protein [Rhodospirillales bacterium]
MSTAICGVQRLKVALDALFDLADAALEFALGEVSVAGVDRLELGAVDGGHGAGEEPQITAETDEPGVPRES